MCWMGVLWPQAICSRVRPKTAAMRSRSAGLGVHRPRRIATTRCSSTPERSASCRASMPAAAHNWSTLLRFSAIVGPSRTAAELRAVAVHVRDFGAVSPRHLVGSDAECGGQALPLLRAGRVAGLRDRLHDAAVEAGRLDELVEAQAALRHPVGYRLD